MAPNLTIQCAALMDYTSTMETLTFPTAAVSSAGAHVCLRKPFSDQLMDDTESFLLSLFMSGHLSYTPWMRAVTTT